MAEKTGWKFIPFSLKVVFFLTIIWILGSLMSLSVRFAEGLPFFGVYIYGISTTLVMLALDIVPSLGLLYAIWKKKSWGVPLAFLYMGIFIINSIVALFTFREELGVMAILVPALFYGAFLTIIHKNKNHFS